MEYNSKEDIIKLAKESKMATIKQIEKEFIKGVFKYYPHYTGQEILGMVNAKRGDVSNHINIGRISEVKRDDSITPMSKKEVDAWISEI